jgi:tetratricopeptide (TPR) repeat protein
MGRRAREKRSRRIEAPARERPATPVAAARSWEWATRDDGAPGSLGDLWCEHRTAVLGLFGLALIVRALVLREIAGTPYFEVANIDSVAYQQWAARIAGGAWWPTGTFYQSPFYAYFLAALATILGPGPWSPRVVQIVLGSLSAVFVYAIGARLFSRRVGWIAGVGLALYGPIVLEEVTFSKTTLLVVTALAGFTLYLWHASAGRLRGVVAAGVLFGVTVVGVGQWLPAFLVLVAWAWMMPEAASSERRLRTAVAFAAGGLAVILPLVAWNSVEGGGLVLTSGDAGLNFFTGNNERASGLGSSPSGVRDTPQYEEADARRLAEQAVGRPLSASEVMRYWSHQGFAWITSHPGDWVALLARKTATLWNGFEIPDNYHYVFMRTHFLPLLRPLVTFGLVAPLALVGATMPFWRRRDVTALYVAAGAYLATILAFYVRGRYRMPAIPFLMVLAAVGVDRVVRAAQARRWPAVAALAGALLVAGVATNHEYCEGPHHGMQGVCLGGDTWFDGEWLKLAEWYRNAGQIDRAIAYADRARECTRPRSPGEIASWIAELETMRTEQLLNDGRRDEAGPHFARAEEHYRTAIKLGFRQGLTQSNLGSLYEIMGKPTEAVAAFEVAQTSGNLDFGAARRLGRAYVAVGRCADAERVLARLDHQRGVATPSDDSRSILAACRASQ